MMNSESEALGTKKLNLLQNTLYRGIPLINTALRRVGMNRTLEAASIERDQLQPGELDQLPLPICIDGQLELAVGTSTHDSLRGQVSLATTKSINHSPVIKYTLKDCVVQPTGVDFLGGSMHLYNTTIRSLVVSQLEEVDSAHYAMSSVSHQYFGHFIRDAAATALLAAPEQQLLLNANRRWPHTEAYLEAFGFTASTPVPKLVRRLTLCVDYSQGSLKKARYEELRRRISLVYGERGPATDTVFLRRGTSGAARNLEDEDYIAESLAIRGCRVVSLDDLTVADLAEKLLQCQRLITMEGSHINHAYFLAPSGLDLCVLMPADRTTFIHRPIVHAFGGRFGYVMCRPSSSGYRLEFEHLLRTLDLF